MFWLLTANMKRQNTLRGRTSLLLQSLPPSLPPSLSLSISLYPSFPLSPFIPLSLSIPLSPSPSLSLPLSPSPSLSLPPSLPLSLSLLLCRFIGWSGELRCIRAVAEEGSVGDRGRCSEQNWLPASPTREVLRSSSSACLELTGDKWHAT